MVDQVGSLGSQSGQGSEGRLPPLGFVLHRQGVRQGYSNVAGPSGMPMSHDHGLMAGGFVMQPPRPGHGGAPLPFVYPPGQRGPPLSYYGGPPAPAPPPFQQSHHQMLMLRPGGVHNGQHFPPPPPPPQPATARSRNSAPGNSPVVTPPQPPLPHAPLIHLAPVAPSSTLLSHSLADSNSHKLALVDRNEDLNQSLLLARSSPSADSDMEMEDDITQLNNDHAPIQHLDGTHTTNLTGSDFEAEKRSDVLQTSEEHIGPFSSSDKVSVEQGNKEDSFNPVPKDDKDFVTASVSSEYENVSDNSDQRVRGASSFKLLQGYSSDDSLENDDKYSSKNTSLQRMMQPATGSDSSSVQKNGNESELHVNLSSSDGAGELQTAVEGTLSKVQTEALDSRKTDRFGRLVREGVINSDSDDSGDCRRRSRRRKSRSRSSSRSRSRSPLDRRWRRGKSPQRRRGKSPQRRRGKSPHRRRGNRSRSRSWSPRRQRSRSRSPSFRRYAGFNDGNERRDRGQMRDCFNFLRGKCYRGSFCRYYHPDAERNDGPRIHRNMQQQYSRTTGAHEDIRESPRKAADHKSETMSSEMLHSRDVPVQNVDDTAIISVTNRNESPVKLADVSLSNFVPEGKSESSPLKCATSGTFPSAEAEGTVHISATLPHLPTSASFSEAVNAPPGIQFGRYPSLVQQGMPFRPPYAPVANASSSSMTIPTPRLLWPVHNPPGSAEVPLPTSIGQFQPNHLPQNHGGSSQMLLGPYSRGFQDQFQVMSGSGSLAEGGILPNSVCLAHESPAMRLQSSSSTILPPGGTSTSSFQEQACSQQQQPLGVVTHSAADTIYDSGKDGNTVPPSHVETNDLSVPRRLTHYNPYASTFEEPPTSRFSSIAFQHEKGALFSAKHGHDNLTVSNASFDGQVIRNVESMQLTSLPKSASSTGFIISGSGADLYDPFDAVGPSLTSIEKVDRNKTGEASDDSENLLRRSGSDKPLDAEENREEECGMDVASSLGSEEFGETANAEVGDVDNASQSNPHATKDHHTGEVQIDQDKSPGKCKKSGDSRSTKLFKACLADFVKEVLKPSWRQGNMSKEAFKTVVKKTVDKVSGAMTGRRAPKSKAKIDQYINSSRPKLTKLVLGYVDKYARG